MKHFTRSRKSWVLEISHLVFFPKQRENLHNGSINIECLNPTVYHQFVNKTHRIHNSYVAFTPHPKSLEGTLPLSEEQQKEFGFCNINLALVNTLEAIQNAPNTQKMKGKVDNKDITDLKIELKKELMKELTTDLKKKACNPEGGHYSHREHLRKEA